MRNARRAFARDNMPGSIFDLVVGTGSDDTLTGTESRDTIEGLAGDDLLFGLGGKDRIDGGNGRDTLLGGRGRDSLIGGARDDLFRFESAKDSRPGQADVITLFRKGDALDLSAIDADKGTAGNQDFVNVAALTGVAGQLAFSSDGGDGTIVEGDVDGDGIADIRIEISRDDRDTLGGTDGDDTLIGYDEGETMGGGTYFSGGDDLLLGAGGDDSLIGGSDNDTLNGAAGNDTLIGGPDFDVISGAEGNDYIVGESFDTSEFSTADNIDGGIGDDTITAIGQSTIVGGSGNDLITIQARPLFPIAVPVLCGDGDDIVIVLSINGAAFILVLGGAGADSITGGNASDTLIGGAGGDTLEGQRRADVFRYEDLLDSTVDASDLIIKLVPADIIDLAAIDANALLGGDQAFDLVADFTGQAGELRRRLDGGTGDTFFEGDVDGDSLADFVIVASGDLTTFGNFVL